MSGVIKCTSVEIEDGTINVINTSAIEMKELEDEIKELEVEINTYLSI